MMPFEATGHWFLPTERETKVPGTLSFDQENGLRLKLFGHLGEVRGDGDYAVIWGEVHRHPRGTAVSLHRAFSTSRTVHSSGPNTEEIVANAGFIGGDFIEENDTFSHARVRIEGLDEWAGVPAADVKMPKAASPGEIRLKAQARQEVPLKGAGELAFVHGARVRTRNGTKSIEVWSETAVESAFDRPLPASAASDRVSYPLQNLMTFLIGRPRAIIGTELKVVMVDADDGPTRDGNDWRTWTSLYYSPTWSVSSSDKSISPWDFLVSSRDCEAPEVVRRWLRFVEENADFCAIWFGGFYAKAKFIETRLANRMLGLRLLLKNESVEMPFAPNELPSIKGLPGERWLAHVWPTAEEARFPWALRALLTRHSQLLEPILHTDLDDLVSQLLAGERFAQMRQGKVERGVRLHWILERIQLLVEAEVLVRLGWTSDEAKKLVSRRSVYRHLTSEPSL